MYSKRIHPTDRPVGSSVHESEVVSIRFVTQAISEIPELSHGIQDRRPRHSKHPSLLAMPTVFSVHFYISQWASSQNLLQSVARLLIRSLLPWMPVTISIKNWQQGARSSLTKHPGTEKKTVTRNWQ